MRCFLMWKVAIVIVGEILRDWSIIRQIRQHLVVVTLGFPATAKVRDVTACHVGDACDSPSGLSMCPVP